MSIALRCRIAATRRLAFETDLRLSWSPWTFRRWRSTRRTPDEARSRTRHADLPIHHGGSGRKTEMTTDRSPRASTSTPSSDRLRILVLGYLVRGPLGGLAWHYVQYVLGLARLGHDVYFLED